MNDALFTKIASSPALNSTQQSVLTKMARTQIRARGGFDALRVAMEDAGSPFTEEQLPKVQALFEDQKNARADLAKESQGTPDPAKLKQLERDTLTKVVGLLIPAQRTACLHCCARSSNDGRLRRLATSARLRFCRRPARPSPSLFLSATYFFADGGGGGGFLLSISATTFHASPSR